MLYDILVEHTINTTELNGSFELISRAQENSLCKNCNERTRQYCNMFLNLASFNHLITKYHISEEEQSILLIGAPSNDLIE